MLIRKFFDIRVTNTKYILILRFVYTKCLPTYFQFKQQLFLEHSTKKNPCGSKGFN